MQPSLPTQLQLSPAPFSSAVKPFYLPLPITLLQVPVPNAVPEVFFQAYRFDHLCALLSERLSAEFCTSDQT